MASLNISLSTGQGIAGWLVECTEPRWYALYSSANREKRVADQLSQRRVEHFLPTFENVRRWKDRKVRLQQPLFPGYLFVRIALLNRLRVLEVPGVVRLVGFNGSPAALSDQEIEILRTSLVPELKALPHPHLRKGRRVRIVNGPLQGTEGILARKKNGLRVVLSIDLIMRAMSVEVDICDIQAV